MKYYWYAVLLLLVTIKASAQSDVATAKWVQQPVVIDGKLTEWNQPLSFYDSDTKLFFAIANDSTTIYLCFESKDEMSQAKLMRAGMKITLSTKGKLKHEASIAYPLSSKQTAGKDGQEMENNTGNASGSYSVHDMSSFRNHFLQSHAVMDVEGFATAKGEVPLTNASGITAALNWDTASNLCYEIAIPRKEFFGADYGSKDISATDINLGVEIKALPNPAGGSDDRGSQHHGGGEEAGGRRGQFNGGGYGSGNEGFRREWSEADKMSLNTKSSFKQKFVLGKAGLN